ncbi:MAG TPA: hypothetical protein VLI04_06475 [Nocardioidaceae bacterium]|nr:hypothetical protein [Nocardioidaceae bacterium]
MKKLLAVLVVSALPLVGLVPPAVAADPVEVVGHDGVANTAGLLAWSNTCGSPNTLPGEQPTKLVNVAGLLGQSSLGWDFTVAGNAAGALPYWADTSGVTHLSTQFLSDGFVAGHVVALFNVNSDFSTGYYVGQTPEFSFDSDNGTQLTSDNVIMDWYFVDGGGNYVAGWDRNDKTIAQLGTEFGDGGGVYAGYVLGCNANSFYLDNLQIGNGTDTVTYDLEAGQTETSTHIEYSLNGSTVRNGNATIGVGKDVWVLGHAHGHHDGVYFAGPGAFYAKTHGQSAFRRIGTDTFDPDFYAALNLTPQRRTVYYFTAPGSELFAPGTSELMVVNVRADVSVKVLDRSLREGQRITARGHIRPRNQGTQVKLQRRIGGGWKTIAKGRTQSKGAFELSAKTTSPGTWVVRVLVEPGNGNLGTQTRKIGVTVKKYVPPPKSTDYDQGNTAPDDGYSTYVPVPDPPEPDRNAPSGRAPAKASLLGQRSAY